MSNKSNLVRVICALFLAFSISVTAFADTIRLKDGSIIKGKIVSFSGGKFTVAIGEGSRQREMIFYVSEIESIQFDSQQAQPENVKIASQPVSTNTKIKYPQPEKISNPPKVVLTDNTPAAKTPSTTPPLAKTTPVITIPEETSEADPVPATISVSKTKPIELSVKVLADNTANGWTNSGWVVKKGQRIRIIGDGSVSLGNGRTSSPSGDATIEDDQKLLKSVATGALIAVIGDDNNEFIYVGAEREFTATRDGALFLGVNEGNLGDNSGAFDVKIEIMPGGSK